MKTNEKKIKWTEKITLVSILPYIYQAMSVECRESGSMWTAVYHCHCDNNKNYAAFIAGLCLFFASLKFNLLNFIRKIVKMEIRQANTQNEWDS